MVGPFVGQSLNISETTYYIFPKLCMTLVVNKVKKVTRPEFKKNINLGFLDFFSESGSLKFLIFCMMVEGSLMHPFSVVLYLGKFLISD